MRNLQKFCSALLLLSLLTGCVAGPVESPPPGGAVSASSPTPNPTPTPEPTPTPPAEIDAASADSEGRVWVRYTGDAQPPIKVQILREGEETAYNYDLPADGTSIALPLTQGEGTYTVSVLEHIEDTRYRPVLTATPPSSTPTAWWTTPAPPPRSSPAGWWRTSRNRGRRSTACSPMWPKSLSTTRRNPPPRPAGR